VYFPGDVIYILSPVSPFDQTTLDPLVETSKVTPRSAHITGLPDTVIRGTEGTVRVVTVRLAEATDTPQILEAVAVYSPSLFTVIVFVVSPVDHLIPSPIACKITFGVFSVSSVLPRAVSTGTGGIALLVTLIVSELSD
jgi:hypothetical protein